MRIATLIGRSRPAVAVALALVLVGGCTGPGPPPSPAKLMPSPASAMPSPGSEFVAGGDRPVTVHVPDGTDPAGAPLLLILHGYTSNGAAMATFLPLGDAAAERGVVWAYPDGTVNERGERFWNATDACCGFGATVDDAAYLIALIDEIAATTRIDRARVYIAGHSNGGFMSHRMACAGAGKVTAIAAISGVTFADPAGCAPTAAVGILQVHGTDDATIPFAGGVIRVPGLQDAAYPGAAETARMWLRFDGCDASLAETTRRIDAVVDLGTPAEPAETTVAESTGCAPGGRVELWTMHGAGHVPAFSRDVSRRRPRFPPGAEAP